MSHVEAIRRAYAFCTSRRLEMAVILEDDVTGDLLPLWTRPLHELTSAMPDNWAVLQLQLIAQEREWVDLRSQWRGRGHDAPASEQRLGRV